MFPEAGRQKGSALTVAVFIIVVMALLVAGLLALLNRQSGTLVYEVLGSRAYLAAQSGIQAGLVRLYPLNGSLGSCSLLSSGDQALAAPGLAGCHYRLSCAEQQSADADLPGRVLRLTSTGQCTGGSLATSRQLAVEVGE